MDYFLPILIGATCMLAVFAVAVAANIARAHGKERSGKEVAQGILVAFLEAADGIYSHLFCREGHKRALEVALRFLKKRYGRKKAFEYGHGEFVVVLEREQGQLEELEFCRNYLGQLLGSRVFSGFVRSSNVRAKSRKELIELAHFAVRRAAEQGLDFLECGPELELEKRDTYELYRDIGSSLEKDEFRPFFFPVIDAASFKVVGCSAICVWNKDVYREIMTKRFAPIAVEKGLLSLIEKRVLEKGLDCLKDWLRSGLVPEGFFVEVALSEGTLKELDASELWDMLSRRGLSSINLRLSSRDFEKLPEVAEKLEGFELAAECGVRSLDIGAASILRRANIWELGQSLQHLKALNKLIESFLENGISLLAKGIENKREFDIARELKVPLLSGPYFSRPQDREKFELFLKKYKEGIPLP